MEPSEERMPRGSSLIFVGLFATLAHGGVIVELVPSPLSETPYVPPGLFELDADVIVDVFLRQDKASEPISVQFLQFDFTASAADLSLPITIPALNLHFWDFRGALCGVGCYSVDDILDAAPPSILSIEWDFDPRATGLQIIVPGDGSPVQVGSFRAFVSAVDAFGWVDLLNRTSSAPGSGAEIRFMLDEELAVLRSNTGEITGGHIEFYTGIPEPSTLLLLGISLGMVACSRTSKSWPNASGDRSITKAG